MARRTARVILWLLLARTLPTASFLTSRPTQLNAARVKARGRAARASMGLLSDPAVIGALGTGAATAATSGTAWVRGALAKRDNETAVALGAAHQHAREELDAALAAASESHAAQLRAERARADEALSRVDARRQELESEIDTVERARKRASEQLEATRATLGTVKQTLEATADELEREMGARAIADGELASACARLEQTERDRAAVRQSARARARASRSSSARRR